MHSLGPRPACRWRRGPATVDDRRVVPDRHRETLRKPHPIVAALKTDPTVAAMARKVRG